jgi:transposase
MMGTKERNFRSLPEDISLEDLVPEDNSYRRLEERLDLSFVREMVEDRYATSGRPSVEPEVFFRLQLVMFHEGIRSERELMRIVADRLSLRWYVGYDLFEPLPDHSSLTRIRGRFGLSVFREFFERIVELCVEAGLVWGEELYFDATKVDANASLDSIAPRFYVEEHLSELFTEEVDLHRFRGLIQTKNSTRKGEQCHEQTRRTRRSFAEKLSGWLEPPMRSIPSPGSLARSVSAMAPFGTG